MKRIIFCLSLFAFFGSQAQQINPVPDYVFSNKMSVGRNAVTDTAAYFSIGPRYGAIRGMMPPMVTDTASMSATKRNGLLIFSIQKNKYLYWDSVGSKWAEMAGTAGSAITGSGVAGYMPEFTTATNIDTTRLYHSNGRFAIGSTTTTNGVFNVYGGGAYFDTSVLVGTNVLFADEANGRVGIGTLTPSSKLHISGAIRMDVDSGQNIMVGVDNSAGQIYTTTIDKNGDTRIGTVRNLIFRTNNTTEQMRINSNGELLLNTTTDVGAYSLQVAGQIYNTNSAVLAIGSGSVGINTTAPTSILHVRTTSQYVANFATTRTQDTITTISLGSYSNSTPGSYGIEINAHTYASSTYASQLSFSTHTGSAMTEKMRIKSDGEVLVGTTTDAGAYALQVTGAIYNTTTLTTGAPTSGSAKPWRLGEAATVSPTSPNRTIRVEIDGTVYYIHAKTTND